jgi:hypothetical protein
MPKKRWLAAVLVAVPLLIAAYVLLHSQGLLDSSGPARVQDVPAGHQEIAFLGPATSADTWERLVAAVKALVKDWPKVYPHAPALVPSFEKAFLHLTADVPEVSLHFAGHERATLWIRWYKLSSESNSRAWIEKLAARDPPPLAIIGGENSDRAYTVARELAEFRNRWQGEAPLFLISTATADHVYPDAYTDPNLEDPAKYPKLMEVYRDRTLRFSFSNMRMAEAMFDFVSLHPEIWGVSPAAVAGTVGHGQGLTAATLLHAAIAARPQPMSLTAMAWEDDPYSRDLSQHFQLAFSPICPVSERRSIAYSAGDSEEPNFRESFEIGRYLEDRQPNENQLLLLPTNAQRARRVLRDLYRRGRSKLGNLIVVSGDSISFDSIYRDNEVFWRFLDMPFPLLFFSHRNPVDEAVGFGAIDAETGLPSKSGTQDLLLYRDILASIIQAAMPKQEFVKDAAALRARLRQIEWRKGQVFHPDYSPALPGDKPGTPGVPLFNDEGNRRPRTGERIVYLRPDMSVPQADLSFWGRINVPTDRTWRPLGKPLTLSVR